METRIFVPTRDRTDRMITIGELLRAELPFAAVTPQSQVDDYRRVLPASVEVIGLPDDKRISGTRHAIVNELCDTQGVVMMDDDLRFYKREDIWDHTLSPCTPEELRALYQWICDGLDEYAHVSVSTREQNFQQSRKLERLETLHLEVERPYRVYAFDREILQGEGVGFGSPVNTMDDFEVTLSLIELGYMNCVSFEYAHNQDGGSNTRGGSSVYRDLEVLANSARMLKERHPDWVTLVEKETTSSWGGTEQNPVVRTDVRIQWKKALGSRELERKLYVGDSTDSGES